MARLIIRTAEPHKGIEAESRFGAYVLQSIPHPELFRIGIAGATNKGTFAGRLQTHRSAANDANWTCRHRPWQPLWTAELQGSTHICVQMAEHALYAAFAKQFEFINESGIAAQPHDAAKLIGVANEAAADIYLIMKQQLAEPVEPPEYY